MKVMSRAMAATFPCHCERSEAIPSTLLVQRDRFEVGAECSAFAAIFLFSLLIFSSRALGEAQLSFLPASRHQQFLTYGLFHEEKNGLLAKSGNTAWSALGASIALLEWDTDLCRTQLIIFGNTEFSFRSKPDSVIDFVTETFDARFGFALENAITESFRISIGIEHISGHAADGIPDPDLIGPNLGDDAIPIRLIFDWGKSFRMGTTFMPLIQWEPHSQWFGADQFVEWFPWEAVDKRSWGSPYLAAGLTENGSQKVALTYHFQAGVYFGNHLGFSSPTLRLLVGYYNGWDPRLKYMRFRQAKAQFFYWGALVNL